MILFRTLITLLLTMNMVSLYSQSRWVNNYLSGEDPFAIDIVESYDNGYLLYGKYGPNYSSFNWLIKTDINGEVLWNKTIGTANVPISFAEIGLNNQGQCYLAGSTYYYSEDNSDPFIMKLDTCGEKEWCKVFIEEDNNYSGAMAVTPDGGVAIILMYMSTIPFINRICLAKFDIDSNIQWKQCYNSPDTSVYNEEAYDLTIAPDGGFLITGHCAYEDPNPPHYWWNKPYYIKTDSLGNFEWETVVHKEISDIGGVAWSTVLSPDSNYFYSSLSHYYHPPFGDAPALLKMDLNGNIVDIYDLAPIDEYGKMIMAKFISDTTLMASAIWGNVLIGGPKAVIIDTLGNIIHQANLLDNEWMASTEVTFDGKLLFLTNIHDDNDNFNAYLFKLNQQLESDTFYTAQYNYDSLCPYQIASDTIVQDNCGLIVGMEEVKPEKEEERNGILIYPNPTKSIFNISIPVLNGNEFTNSSCIIEIFDIYGRKVKEIKVPKGQNKIEVYVGGWRKGLYLVRVRTGQNVFGSEKVIVN